MKRENQLFSMYNNFLTKVNFRKPLFGAFSPDLSLSRLKIIICDGRRISNGLATEPTRMLEHRTQSRLVYREPSFSGPQASFEFKLFYLLKQIVFHKKHCLVKIERRKSKLLGVLFAIDSWFFTISNDNLEVILSGISSSSSSSLSDGRVRRGNKKLPIRLVFGVSDIVLNTERRSRVAAGNLFQECVPQSSKLRLDVVVRTTCTSLLAALRVVAINAW